MFSARTSWLMACVAIALFGCSAEPYEPVQQLAPYEVRAEFGFDERADEAERTAKVIARMHHFHRQQIELANEASQTLHGAPARLARLLQRDHQRADAALLELADELDLELPEPEIPASRRNQMATLRSKLRVAGNQGYARVWLDAVKTMHGDAILMLTNVAPRVDDELVDLLQEQVPVLGQHYALSDLLLAREAGL